MSNYSYQEALPLMGEDVALFNFGPGDGATWFFSPAYAQLYVKNENTGNLFMTYSGYISLVSGTPVYFQCAPIGGGATIGTNKEAYFSNYNETAYAALNPNFKITGTGQWMRCSDVSVIFGNEMNARYEFEFLIKNFEELNSILIAGDKLGA